MAGMKRMPVLYNGLPLLMRQLSYSRLLRKLCVKWNCSYNFHVTQTFAIACNFLIRQNDKPGSVVCDHLSRPSVTERLKRPA